MNAIPNSADEDFSESIRRESECAGVSPANIAIRVIRGVRSVILEIVDMSAEPRSVQRFFLDKGAAECFAQNIQESARYLDSNAHECTASNPFVN